ncbi:MAG: hypothetical protein V4631_13670 [Pseudomonadota bacterium]
MRQRIIDLRNDEDTAARIAQALQLQAEYGFEYACEHLLAHGVNVQLAQRVLAVRYDRRREFAAAAPIPTEHRNLGPRVREDDVVA